MHCKMKHILIPDAEEKSLGFYLAMEEFVAREIADEAFFVWRVAPTVIIGRNQILENEVDLEYCQSHSVDIVRRKSGGGCVYSDKGNIMISYVSRKGDVTAVFDRYLSELTASLCSLGLDAMRSGRNDVMVDGYKVSGNAFRQLPHRSIVHGTMLYSTDMDALAKAILPPFEKLQRHGVESVRQRVTNLSAYASLHPALASIEALEDYLVACFTDGEILLSPEQVKQIEDTMNN